MFTLGDILIIVFVSIAAIVAGLYFLNKWATKKVSTNQSVIEKSKQTVSLYVIDKKRDMAANVNLPKAVSEKLPRIYKFVKMYFVQAKIGPQIMTLMCEKKVFKNIPVKKTIKVDIAGIYIVAVKGARSEHEIKQMKKEKKAAKKAKTT